MDAGEVLQILIHNNFVQIATMANSKVKTITLIQKSTTESWCLAKRMCYATG